MPKNPTTVPGYTNQNKQSLLERTSFPSTTFRGQVIYRMKCGNCKHVYGANGCDIHIRKCPNCQSGTRGEPLREPPPTLDFGI